eukprot:GFUD01137296.1.p1 GENE.GFUD01137296.1~~GFUD01137296.1.p1  ORF type:complete len:152 (-),score=6.65 GFUD01137296.1:126-581(-)
MGTVHRYVLEPVRTSGLDVKTIAEVLEVIETALGSVYDFERLSVVLERMLGCHVMISVVGMRDTNDLMVSGLGFWKRPVPTITIKCRNLALWNTMTPLHIKAKFQGVRSLQDLTAHHVACSIRNNLVSLEQLPITIVTKKVVTKFIETAQG